MYLLKDVCKRLRVPNDCKELAVMVAKFHGKLHQVCKMRADTLVEFLTELDAFRQPTRFMDFLKACECDSRGRTGLEDCALPETSLILTALQAAQNIDAGAVAKQHIEPEKIKEAIFEARLEKVRALIT